MLSISDDINIVRRKRNKIEKNNDFHHGMIEVVLILLHLEGKDIKTYCFNKLMDIVPFVVGMARLQMWLISVGH